MIDTLSLWALAPSHVDEARAVGFSPPARHSAGGSGVGVVPLIGSLNKDRLVWAKEQINALAASDSVGEIVLHIDSPGGGLPGVADCYSAVAKAAARKRVTAFIEDIGASAAYWVASAATEIICNRTALVGSIGVFIAIADSSEFWQRLGVTWFVIKSGAAKGTGVEGAKLSAEDIAKLQARVDAMADLFVGDVARGRRLAVDRVRELATGETWIGEEARKIGLVDRVASLDEVLSESQLRTQNFAFHDLVGREAADKFAELVAEEVRTRMRPEAECRQSIRWRYPRLADAVDEHAARVKADEDRYYRSVKATRY